MSLDTYKSVNLLKAAMPNRSGTAGMPVGEDVFRSLMLQLFPLCYRGSTVGMGEMEAAVVKSREMYDHLVNRSFFPGLVEEYGGNVGRLLQEYGPALAAEATHEVRFGVSGELVSEMLLPALALVRDWDPQPATAVLAAATSTEPPGVRRDEPEGSGSRGLVLVSVLIVLVLVTLVFVFRRRAPSRDFSLLAPLARKHEWARAMLRCGTGAHAWTLGTAWKSAVGGMTDADVHTALQVLGQLPPGKPLEPKPGDRFDAETMAAVNGPGPHDRWVHAVHRNGLLWEGVLIEKARVGCASSDYMCLAALKEMPFTQYYMQAVTQGWTCLDLRFNGARLSAVKDQAGSEKELDQWIAALISAAPGKDLQPVAEKPGVPVSEKTMQVFNRDSILVLSEARVSRILSRGLKRSNGEILLRAQIEAQS